MVTKITVITVIIKITVITVTNMINAVIVVIVEIMEDEIIVISTDLMIKTERIIVGEFITEAIN